MIRSDAVRALIRFVLWLTRTELYTDGGYEVMDADWRTGRVGVVPKVPE